MADTLCSEKKTMWESELRGLSANIMNNYGTKPKFYITTSWRWMEALIDVTSYDWQPLSDGRVSRFVFGLQPGHSHIYVLEAAV